MPPSYGSQEYWNKRFVDEPEPFEWLGAPNMLDPYLKDALSSCAEANPRLLHIGCGTSVLAHHLRALVREAKQVHNLDYSQVAIDLGRKREKELQASLSNATGNRMRWDPVDMLDHNSFLNACKPGAYDVIVDKSTSDSIACCDNVHIRLPYTIDLYPESAATIDTTQPSESIHPLHILAVHLALMTRPGARWIALSYSSDRFPFIDGLYSSRPHLPGFPDTGTLWKLLDKQEVSSPTEESDFDGHGNGVIHRPKTSHWIYILERTEVPLFIRGGHL